MTKVKVLEGQQLANETDGGVHEAGETVDLDDVAAERAVQMGIVEVVKASSSSSSSSKGDAKGAK